MSNFPYSYLAYQYSYPFLYPAQQTPYFPYFMTPFAQQFLNAPAALEKAEFIEDRLLEQKKQPSIKIETNQADHLVKLQSPPENSDQNNRRQRNTKKSQQNLFIPKRFKESKRQAINELYTIKNIEANVVNQIYSFISNAQKCGQYISVYFGDKCDKIDKFNHYIKIIKKCNKRYIKKNYLVHLCKLQNGHVGHLKLTRNENYLKILSIEQFCKCVRYLVRLYLSNICPIAILTSKKMNKNLWLRHLAKCRQINDYIFCSEQQRKQLQFAQKSK